MHDQVIRAGLEPKNPKLAAIIRCRCISAGQRLSASVLITEYERLHLCAPHGTAFIIHNTAGENTRWMA